MLVCERHGAGEPLVLVHGVTHRRQAWYPVLDRLTDHREVILVDLPGHGGSPDLDLAGRTVEETLRAEFQAFLADQGLDRPHVAGNSLGMLTAHPGRVSPDQARGDIRGFIRARPALSVLLDSATPFEREIALDVPVTIAWAARDLVLPPWQAQVARRRLPFAQHLMLKGVGHVPMTDNPALVADVLLAGSAASADIALLLPARRARSASSRSPMARSAAGAASA